MRKETNFGQDARKLHQIDAEVEQKARSRSQ